MQTRIILGIALALSLAGCGQVDTGPYTPPTNNASGTTGGGSAGGTPAGGTSGGTDGGTGGGTGGGIGNVSGEVNENGVPLAILNHLWIKNDTSGGLATGDPNEYTRINNLAVQIIYKLRAADNCFTVTAVKGLTNLGNNVFKHEYTEFVGGNDVYGISTSEQLFDNTDTEIVASGNQMLFTRIILGERETKPTTYTRYDSLYYFDVPLCT